MIPFASRLSSAPVNGGYQEPDHWIWCGSVIRGADGQFHMFASRWSKAVPFSPNWLTNSRVVRAVSPTPEGPYTYAYVWHEDGLYQMIFNDMTGRITGEDHAGAHAVSEDGIAWRLADPPKAYSRTVRWSDGTITHQGSFERPQLLIQDGHPTYLFAATGDGPGGFWNASHTWNMGMPLGRLTNRRSSS
jgi:hypothetical protein